MRCVARLCGLYSWLAGPEVEAIQRKQKQQQQLKSSTDFLSLIIHSQQKRRLEPVLRAVKTPRRPSSSKVTSLFQRTYMCVWWMSNRKPARKQLPAQVPVTVQYMKWKDFTLWLQTRTWTSGERRHVRDEVKGHPFWQMLRRRRRYHGLSCSRYT